MCPIYSLTDHIFYVDYVTNKKENLKFKEILFFGKRLASSIASFFANVLRGIVGKVKYLLKRYNYTPDEILVLSFTNASAAEMAEWIKCETNAKIDVMILHK